MAADYEFRTARRLAGTVDEVRDRLADGPSLARWWPAVHLSGETLNERAVSGTLLITEPTTATGATSRAMAGGRSGRRVPSRDHLQPAGEREETAAAPSSLAAAMACGQPPMGERARRGGPALGAASPPSDSNAQRRPAPQAIFRWLIGRQAV